VLILALSDWLLLAQEAAGGGAAPGGTAPAQPESPGFAGMLPALLGIMALFYFLILRPQKAKDQQFRSMVDALKEKDRVVTIGGIHGVVTNVQREAGVITLRVDESTGAKIRVNASAIAKVITDEESAESPKAS
jgi:preprotein translocase subunit YajC